MKFKKFSQIFPSSHYAFLLPNVALLKYVRAFIAIYCGNVEKHFFNITFEQKINDLKSRRRQMRKHKIITIYFL